MINLHKRSIWRAAAPPSSPQLCSHDRIVQLVFLSDLQTFVGSHFQHVGLCVAFWEMTSDSFPFIFRLFVPPGTVRLSLYCSLEKFSHYISEINCSLNTLKLLREQVVTLLTTNAMTDDNCYYTTIFSDKEIPFTFSNITLCKPWKCKQRAI